MFWRSCSSSDTGVLYLKFSLRVKFGQPAINNMSVSSNLIACAFAPGRVELLGNHTDYNEGLVLSFGLDQVVSITATKIVVDREFADTIRVTAELFNGEHFDLELKRGVMTVGPSPSSCVPRWGSYVLGTMNEYLAEFGELLKKDSLLGSFELSIRSNLPMGWGLSSSAALECAVAKILLHLWPFHSASGSVMSAEAVLENQNFVIRLARVCQRAEHKYAGVMCGLLDQISSLCAREGQILLTDFRSLTVRYLDAPHHVQFVLIMSEKSHNLSEAVDDGQYPPGVNPYNHLRSLCHSAAQKLRVPFLRDVPSLENRSDFPELSDDEYKRASHVVGEDNRVNRAAELCHSPTFAEELGKMMTASHRSSQFMFGNSCADLDFLVDAASSCPGWLGGRLSGGGFGGCTIHMVRADAVDSFLAHMRSKFVERYHREPQVLLIRPSSGKPVAA